MGLTEGRIERAVQLGRVLSAFSVGKELRGYENAFEQLSKIIPECFFQNGWFTSVEVKKALGNLSFMLQEGDLKAALIHGNEASKIKTIGIIMAGNIPAVGFHDLLAVYLSGHNAAVKLSSSDSLLIPLLGEFLAEGMEGENNRISYSGLAGKKVDAVIASGHAHSAEIFRTYFAKQPHIIRGHRNSIAVLTGKETPDELGLLGCDIFDFYGLGCRNVSALLVPEGYNFSSFFEAIFSFSWVLDNKKYANNYEYYRAIYLMDGVKFLDNNFLCLRESAALDAPIGVLNYQYYKNEEFVEKIISENAEKIQCVVSGKIVGHRKVDFGGSQAPRFPDYPDNINTLAFLNNLV